MDDALSFMNGVVSFLGVYGGVFGRYGLVLFGSCFVYVISSVRVRPKSSRGFAKPSEHQSNGCETKERQRGPIEVLEIFRQAPAPSEPAKAAFHDPSFRQHLKALGDVGSFHDLDRQAGHGMSRRCGEHWPLIATVGEKLRQEREASKQRVQYQAAAIAVLDIRRMHEPVQHQAQRIDQDMSLLAFDFLTRIVSRRIDRGPPFSALFTLWLSITHAVGLASRSACSRQAT